MHLDQPSERIGYRGGALSRAKQLALKAAIIVVGAVTLASAFVLSLVFVAIGLVVVATLGGFLWWKTRDFRREMRARMEAHRPPESGGRIIEGEVVSREDTRR